MADTTILLTDRRTGLETTPEVATDGAVWIRGPAQVSAEIRAMQEDKREHHAALARMVQLERAALVMVPRGCIVPYRVMNLPESTAVLLDDTEGAANDLANWLQADRLLSWASCIIIHVGPATAQDYQAHAGRTLEAGRLLLIETTTRRRSVWEDAAACHHHGFRVVMSGQRSAA